jgi:hypothetical protein
MVFRLFFLLGFILLFSCKENKASLLYAEEEQKETAIAPAQVLLKTPASLTTSEYLAFLKQMKGVAFDEVENNQVYLSILYKPQIVEAALSLAPEEVETLYKEALVQKKGYYYFLINYLDKNPSITGNRPSKKEVLKGISEHLMVIRNQADTLQHIIIETIPSSVAGQPDQVVVLIPEVEGDLRLQVLLPNVFIDDRSLGLDLSMDVLKKFPALTVSK